MKNRQCRMVTNTGGLSCGRSGGIRTRDPLLPKQMRYQAALRSDSSYSNLYFWTFQRISEKLVLPGFNAKAQAPDLPNGGK